MRKCLLFAEDQVLIVNDEDAIEYMARRKNTRSGDLNNVIKCCREYKNPGSTERNIQQKQNFRAKQQLNSILWSTSITLKTKINTYKHIIEPITTYGAENWTITSRTKERLKAVEMDFLR